MNKPDTRTRLINTMQRSLQRNGLHGTGLTELLSLAKAPKGSLYHHFPGGKEELAMAAIAQTADQLERFFSRLFSEHADPLDAVAHWIQSALRRIEASEFSLGCPLAAAALDSGPEDGPRSRRYSASGACFSRPAGAGSIATKGFSP